MNEVKKMQSKYLIADALCFDPWAKTITNIKTEVIVDIHTPAANCLLALIMNKGKTLPQLELYRAGWGDGAIKTTTSATYYQCFVNLRKQIKNTGYDKDILRTIPKQGMQLDASVIKLKDESCENHSGAMKGFKKKRSDSFVFYLFFLFILITLVCAFTFFMLSRKEYASDSFLKIAELPDCMRVKSLVLLPIDEIKETIHKMKLSCSSDKPVFITAGWNRTTVFYCNKGLTICKSRTEIITHD